MCEMNIASVYMLALLSYGIIVVAIGLWVVWAERGGVGRKGLEPF